MATGDQRTDPITNEPEIELADGTWTTDWNALGDGPQTPTSMHITSVSGNQTGNGFTTNGVYRSNNTGPLQNTGFGNWTWRVKSTRIGNWIQHMYWNDTGNIAFRESFNGGSSWTSWAA